MEQLTGSKLGKEYHNAVYCHLAYLTYIQNMTYDNKLNKEYIKAVYCHSAYSTYMQSASD